MRCSLLSAALLLCAVCALFAAAHPTPSSSSSPSKLDSAAAEADLPPDTFRKLAQALYQRSGGANGAGGAAEEAFLTKKMLYNREVTCNDGSAAGYYIRRNYQSRRWVVFLEGGWICHDDASCQERGRLERHRMSSRHWPRTRSVGGALSAAAAENPHLADANHVFVPYCSSDSWSGTKRGGDGQLAFMGSAILRQVVAELAHFEDLLRADEFFLAGSSAGATGVLVNLDAVADALEPAGVAVRGIVDSGWFLDDQNCGSHSDASPPSSPRCSVIRDLKRGVQMWDAEVPQACNDAFPGEPWKCFFGYHIYPTIKTPLFIFQWQFDTFQLYADNMAHVMSGSAPRRVGVGPSHSDRISATGAALRRSLSDVTAVFAPSCIAHEVLTRPDWAGVAVDGVTLPDAIQCWADSIANEQGEEESAATLEDVLHSLGVEFRTTDLPVSDQGNQIVVPVSRIHSRTAPMFSHDVDKPFKVGSNYLKSLDDIDRNRIGTGADRDHNRDIKSNRTSRHGKKGRRRRRKRHRNKKNRRRNRKQRVRCHPESNSCEESQRMQRGSHNKSIVRSLDRRSSHNKGNNGGKKRSRRKGKRRKADSSDETAEERKLRREEKRRRRRERRRMQKEKKRQRERRRKEKLVEDISQMVARSNTRQRRSSSSTLQCGRPNLRLVDSCAFPHCNPSCPRARNPETGREVDLLTVLESFGLDKRSVARAMDVDVHTLSGMRRQDLLHRLNGGD